MKWEELSKEEKEAWQIRADEINNEGLGNFARRLKALLDDGIVKMVSGKPVISGEFAFKMQSEKGIPKDVLPDIIHKFLHD